ncbi:hypothetical protein WR25_02545 [Diploscapter pachys]|uniref:Uncharacterized protein n=1 Tax=Diploscapter pachys TaxID=2018661 RepID=A0A2A2KU98_9BILA|nr:hypothetical protein WR25_02545 [Diploscapter pachys]
MQMDELRTSNHPNRNLFWKWIDENKDKLEKAGCTFHEEKPASPKPRDIYERDVNEFTIYRWQKACIGAKTKVPKACIPPMSKNEGLRKQKLAKNQKYRQENREEYNEKQRQRRQKNRAKINEKIAWMKKVTKGQIRAKIVYIGGLTDLEGVWERESAQQADAQNPGGSVCVIVWREVMFVYLLVVLPGYPARDN